MSAQVIRGSKQEIAEKIMQMPGEVREAIVVADDPASPVELVPYTPGEDIFAEGGRRITFPLHHSSQPGVLTVEAVHAAEEGAARQEDAAHGGTL